MVRRALRPNRARRQVAGSPKTIPAPYKGWYTLESDTQMPVGSAKILDNFWPEADSTLLRRGSLTRNSDLPGSVNTLMAYRSAAKRRLLAAAGGGLYDITPGRPQTRLKLLSETQCSFVNFAGSGGQFLITVNGADAPAKFDGDNFTAVNVAGGGPANINDLNFVWSYRARLYFLARNSTVVYYLPADSIGGTLSQIDIGSSLTKGGSLIAGGRWTVDAGEGPDDIFVVVSDEGQLVIFSGRDPGAAEWQRVGVFDIGKPVGPRCLRNIGGDLTILCDDGLIPLSTIIRFDRAQQKKASATTNIAKAFNETIRQRGRGGVWGVYGWQEGTMLICNVPGAPAVAQQYVMNLQTGAWARFTGLDATCWEEFDGKAYFGTQDGRVVEFWHGSTDDTKPIRGTVLPAFSNLGYSGIKTNALLRTNLVTSDQVAVQLGLATDFDITVRDLISLDLGSPESLWDLSAWDVTPWAQDDTDRVQGWQDAPGVGYTFAPVLIVETVNLGPDYVVTCRLISFDLVSMNGGL